MKPICTAQQVRALDQAMIHEIGVPGVALMDQASRGMAEVIHARFASLARAGVTVVCGPGNNGGDGYACARWLKGWGYEVATWSLSANASGDAGIMRRACRHAGVPERHHIGDVGLIVDAVFGTGLTRPVVGEMAAVLQAINAHPAAVVAADVPSGLNADTGAHGEVVVRADHTVTFGRWKPCFFTAAERWIGGATLVDIGLDVVAGDTPLAQLMERRDFEGTWPLRGPRDHKYRAGHLLVVAGSPQMPGAAVLACEGALAAGVGLVTLGATAGTHAAVQGLPPEVMRLTLGEGDDLVWPSGQGLGRFHGVAAGPGLGGGRPLTATTAETLSMLWKTARCPVVFDADALALPLEHAGGPRVITPHAGEASRRLGVSAEDVESARFESARKLVMPEVAVLLKGRHTLVVDGDGPIFVNPTGHAVLGTAGSGDVLTGLVGALMARGLVPMDAARLGAYVHGLTGETLAQSCLEGRRASDIARALSQVAHELVMTKTSAHALP